MQSNTIDQIEEPGKAIQSSRIYLQLGIYLFGFIMLAGLQYFFSHLNSEITNKINNENVRLQIGNLIHDDIQKIETLTYKMAVSTTRKQRNLYKKKLDAEYQKITQALDVLNKGGVINRIKQLNLADQEVTEHRLVYHKQPDSEPYSMEVIELSPTINKIRDMINELYLLVQNRDTRDTAQGYELKAIRVKHKLHSLSPLFERVVENTNRLFYESQKKLKQLRQEKTAQNKYYTVIELSLSLLIIILVMFFGYVIIRQIQNTNNKLSETTRELNFQIKALNAHAIVSSTDVKGNITHVNQRFCEISGYSEQELLGQNHRIIKSDEHSKEFFRTMWKTIASGKIWHGEIKNVSKSGRPYWVDATVIPLINGQKKPFRYISIRTDITQRKKMEEEISKNHRFLQSMTDAMGEAVYTLDAKGICTSVNPEFEHLTGWKKEEVIGQNIHELIHFQTPDGTYVPTHECPTHKSIRDGKKYISDDEYFTHKNGTMFPVSIISVPLYEQGEINGSVAIFQDISLRKKTEKALLDAKLQAEQASKEKSNFLANMSHEIRTPMNAIIGMSYLALQSDLKPEPLNYIQKVHFSAKALLNIINDILDFSKIEAGKLTIENIEFEFNSVIENIQMLLSDKAREKNLALDFDIDKDIPPVLIGDPHRLNQVLVNLGNNALKFTDQGNIVISARVDKINDDNSIHVRFSVKDSGIGISKEQQNKLFKSFSQADTSTTRKYGGTGLGLTISKQLTELMGGNIWLESEYGKGSTFHFTIRFKQVDDVQQSLLRLKAQQSNKHDHQEFARQLYGAHILLVEDNAFNQELATDLLKRHHIQVTLACNGQEALDKLQSDHFDGILMDIQMPVMNGYDATKKIRADAKYQAIPIIAMTASTMVSDEQKARDAGMNDHISKPINVHEMFSTMAKWIKPANRIIPEPSDTEQAEPRTSYDFSVLQSIDYQYALQRLDNDQAIYVEILQKFIDDHADDLFKIRAAVSTHSIDQALLLAHTFKGVTGNVGLTALHEKAIELENCLKSGELCADIMTQAENLLTQDASAIKQFLRQAHADMDSGAALEELNEQTLADLLKELLSLLDAYDTEAAKKLARLRESSFSREHSDVLDKLKNNIESYNFEQASALVSELINQLNRH